MISGHNFHDATLCSVTVDWGTGDVTLAVRASGPPAALVMIRGRGLSNLVCPRVHPWGPSVSINTLEAFAADAAELLRVEMQSGDIVEVRAREFTIEEP